MKLLTILATESVLLLIHIASNMIAKYVVNFKAEWLGNAIFFILSIIAIWFIFFTNNQE